MSIGIAIGIAILLNLEYRYRYRRYFYAEISPSVSGILLLGPIVKITELLLLVASSNEHVALLAACVRRQFNNIWNVLICVYR
jgi:hypothetical protein